MAREFPSQEALNQYMQAHPRARAVNHWVKGQGHKPGTDADKPSAANPNNDAPESDQQPSSKPEAPAKPKRKRKSAPKPAAKPEPPVEDEASLPFKIEAAELKKLSGVLGTKSLTVHELKKMNGYGSLPKDYGIDIRYVESRNPLKCEMMAYLTHKGSVCGKLKRTYVRREGKLRVFHDQFFMDEGHQGGGVGKAVFNAQIDAYEKLGVDKVELTAAKVGKYVWSKAGFEWTNEKQFEGVKLKVWEHLAGELGMDHDDVDEIMTNVHTGEDIAHLEVGGKRVGKHVLVKLTWQDIFAMDEDAGEYILMEQSPSKIKRL